MKAAKFNDAQKAFILKQGEESTSGAEICRKEGIEQSTGTDDVTAPDGIDVPSWVCNDPQRRTVTSSEPNHSISKKWPMPSILLL